MGWLGSNVGNAAPDCQPLAYKKKDEVEAADGRGDLFEKQLDQRGFVPESALRNQKFADSPLEGRVRSEPVSEMGFFGSGITARFQDVYG